MSSYVAKSGSAPKYLADALECGRLDDGPDIVDDEPRDRALRLCGGDDAEKTAHRRPDPVDGFGAASCDQRDERSEVGRKDVVVRVGEPVALAAAGHVDREDAMGRGERFAQHVEVAAVPSHAMHADDDARIAGVAPLVVDDTMKPVRRQAAEVVPAGFEGGERHAEVSWFDAGQIRIVGDRCAFVNRDWRP